MYALLLARTYVVYFGSAQALINYHNKLENLKYNCFYICYKLFYKLYWTTYENKLKKLGP
jgi:hypothetical protein